jgi:hypothetical protein
MVIPRLQPQVLAELGRHGVVPADSDTPESLRERLNERYLADVRQLRDRQTAGEIPLKAYAGHVHALKESYPLLGLPLTLWLAPQAGGPAS